MGKVAYQAKHARGVVLTTLQAYYPNGLSGGNLYAHALRPVFPGMSWDDALQHLFYLKGRGFIELVPGSGIRDAGTPRDQIFRVTPEGLDVAAGVSEDDGVLVEA